MWVFFLSLGYSLIVHPDCLVLLMTHWNGHIGWFQLAASSAWTEAKPPVRDVLRWIWPFATVRRCGVIKWYKLASWCKLFSTSLLFRIPKRTLKLLPILMYVCMWTATEIYIDGDKICGYLWRVSFLVSNYPNFRALKSWAINLSPVV